MYSKTYSKIVDAGKLWDELEIVFPDLNDVHTFIDNGTDKVQVTFDNSKDGAEQAIIDSIVTAHVPVDLEDLKKKKNALIDEKTKELIYAGFAYDNNVFSLSSNAQRNWLALNSVWSANFFVTQELNPTFTPAQVYDAVESSLYPSPVTTLDDLEYIFNTYAEYVTFFNAIFAFANGHYLSGRALKEQVNNAVDQAELNSIIDNR